MEELFAQVGSAAENGLYFLALAGALIIPDICGALEQPDGQARPAAYKAWFDGHMPQSFMDGDTCYKFRCSLLHQGTTQDPHSTYSRIVFIEPGTTTITAHMNVFNDALNIDVRLFCRDIVRAAMRWQQAVAGTEPYQTNVKKFVTRYPNGLAPYIAGVPVIS